MSNSEIQNLDVDKILAWLLSPSVNDAARKVVRDKLVLHLLAQTEVDFNQEYWAALLSKELAGINVVPVAAIAENSFSLIGNKKGDLENIFDLQLKLIEKYGIAPKQVRLQGRGAKTTVLIRLGYATIREVVEIIDELPWKWWRVRQKPVDKEKLKDEVIDLLHLVIEFCILVGMDARETVSRYIAKNKINLERVEEAQDDEDEDDNW